MHKRLNMIHQKISKLLPLIGVGEYYIVDTLSIRTTKAGAPFVAGTLRDASGTIPFVMWNDIDQVNVNDVGKVFFVVGQVGEFRGALQFTVKSMELATDADSGDFQLSDLVPYAPLDVQNTLDSMGKMLESLSDSDYCWFCYFGFFLPLSNFLEVWPAAKSVHHAFVGGWVMHTWNMMCMAEAMYQQYGDIYPIDHDLLIAGTFLHDIGKLHEFDLTDHHLVQDYTVDGNLLGHPLIGVIMVELEARVNGLDTQKLLQLEHIIASHHGAREFGAIVPPQTIEAEIVHYLDGLDSRAEIYRSELEKTPVGKFSDFNRALEHSVYNHGKAS